MGTSSAAAAASEEVEEHRVPGRWLRLGPEAFGSMRVVVDMPGRLLMPARLARLPAGPEACLVFRSLQISSTVFFAPPDEVLISFRGGQMQRCCQGSKHLNLPCIDKIIRSEP